MTRVDFYILENALPNGENVFACRLVEKIYSAGHQVYIHTKNAQQAAALDDLLWTFRPGSFLPHARPRAHPNDDDAPIIIGHGELPGDINDVVVNLTDHAVTTKSRIAEIVPANDSAKHAARTRFRAYRDAGATLHTHNVSI